MNNIKKRLILSCAAIGFTSFALLASAQEQSCGNCKDQVNKEECHQAQMAKFKAMRESKWHDELKITEAQEPAWKKFTESHQPGAMHSEQHGKFSRTDAEKIPAPERLEKRLARMENGQATMKTRLAALKTLYAELTPEQQTLLNKRIAQAESKHRHHQRQEGRQAKKSDQVTEK